MDTETVVVEDKLSFGEAVNIFGGHGLKTKGLRFVSWSQDAETGRQSVCLRQKDGKLVFVRSDGTIRWAGEDSWR